MSIEQRLEKLHGRVITLTEGISKMNPCHKPPGPAGGQFCSLKGGGAKGGGGAKKKPAKPSDKELVDQFAANVRPEAKGMVEYMREQLGDKVWSSGTSVELGRQKAWGYKTVTDTERFQQTSHIEMDRRGTWTVEHRGMFKGKDAMIFEDRNPAHGVGLESLKAYWEKGVRPQTGG